MHIMLKSYHKKQKAEITPPEKNRKGGISAMPKKSAFIVKSFTVIR